MEELRKFAREIWNAVFPETACFVCGEELNDEKLCLCKSCKSEFVFATNVCLKCGSPIENGKLCSMCRNRKRTFAVARAPLVFDGKVREIVWNFKYNKRPDLAKYLARFMEPLFCEFGEVDVLIPVPLHDHKLKLRGYNQSKLLAEELSKLVGVEVDCESLIRVKNTETQTNLNFEQRRDNMKDAFEVVGDGFKGKHVLVVDDVLTTGATAESCATALAKAGASCVDVLTVATVDLEKSVSKKSETAV